MTHHNQTKELNTWFLKRGVRCRVLTMHALSRTVVCELCRVELASAVGTKCL
jgi:hypothetical protein